MKTSQLKTKLSWEVQEVKWFTATEAIKMVEYKNSVDILNKAIRMISKLKTSKSEKYGKGKKVI